MTNVWHFETENFTVSFQALPDDDLDLSFDEDGSVAEKLENGEFIAFTAKVSVCLKTATSDIELGTSYLAGCIYNTYEEFMDHKEVGKKNKEWQAQGSTARCGSYFSQMVTDAINEARAALKRLPNMRQAS